MPAARLGLLSIIFIVALRFMIGFHFYREGASKFQNPNWTSRAFMSMAVGPFADNYHAMVPDKDLLVPEDKDKLKLRAFNPDKKATVEAIADIPTIVTWQNFKTDVENYYGFGDARKEQAQKIFDAHVEELAWVLDVYQNELLRYEAGKKLAGKMEADPNYTKVYSRDGQISFVEKEANDQGTSVVNDIETIWKTYESELNALAKEEGYSSATTNAEDEHERFTITAKEPGGKLDGITIKLVKDDEIKLGQETATLDLEKKTLTLTFVEGETTSAHLRNAIRRNEQADELFVVTEKPGNGRGLVTADHTAVTGGGGALENADLPPVVLERPYSEVEADLAYVDSWIPYIHVSLGICLMIGFLVRFWSVIGSIFLISVIASQFPFDFATWSYVEPALPPFYQCVELLALLFLGAVGAGRFAGVDFLLWSGYRYFMASKSKPGTSARPATT